LLLLIPPNPSPQSPLLIRVGSRRSCFHVSKITTRQQPIDHHSKVPDTNTPSILIIQRSRSLIIPHQSPPFPTSTSSSFKSTTKKSRAILTSTYNLPQCPPQTSHSPQPTSTLPSSPLHSLSAPCSPSLTPNPQSAKWTFRHASTPRPPPKQS
jgi:hypothetical protein